MDSCGHVPVLVEEVLAVLQPRPGETVVDCTVGRGGHAVAFGKAAGRAGTVIGLDVDESNLDFATQRMQTEADARFVPIHDSFVRVADHMRRLKARADVVLADLGFSSSQMDDPARGFSFGAEGPLDMRLDPSGPMTAADLLTNLSERELADVIYRYGEEPLARRIARKLAQTRHDQPIATTAELARLVVEAYGARARKSRLHPATRTFMALRIAVNDELGALQALMGSIAAPSHDWLNPGARIGVISFHSLEDRIVKHAFADLFRQGRAKRLPESSRGRPITASDEEVMANPRARSAKLRAIQIG